MKPLWLPCRPTSKRDLLAGESLERIADGYSQAPNTSVQRTIALCIAPWHRHPTGVSAIHISNLLIECNNLVTPRTQGTSAVPCVHVPSLLADHDSLCTPQNTAAQFVCMLYATKDTNPSCFGCKQQCAHPTASPHIKHCQTWSSEACTQQHCHSHPS